jgi:hypothetical protein
MIRAQTATTFLRVGGRLVELERNPGGQVVARDTERADVYGKGSSVDEALGLYRVSARIHGLYLPGAGKTS